MDNTTNGTDDDAEKTTSSVDEAAGKGTLDSAEVSNNEEVSNTAIITEGEEQVKVNDVAETASEEGNEDELQKGSEADVSESKDGSADCGNNESENCAAASEAVEIVRPEEGDEESESRDNDSTATEVQQSKVNLGNSASQCCVQDCPTNTTADKSKNTFVTFPKDPSRFTEWTRAINRPDLLTFMGKKDSKILLVCSRHFPKDMWVNSNARLKRLHKNAIPEITLASDGVIAAEDDGDDDDDDDVVIIPSESRAPKTIAGKRAVGIKVKKVTSLLSESALKDSMNPAESVSTFSVTSDLITRKTGTTRWPSILHRKQAMASTDMEKKLLVENNNLKSELDKNMDYILNQKSHYEALLAKEKEKSSTLSNKVTQLEAEHRKLYKNFETQLNAQKSKTTNKEAGQKELNDKLRKAQTLNAEYEKKLNEAQTTITSLRVSNDSLTLKVNEMAESSPPPPPENLLQAENFRAFLNSYVKTYRHMKQKIQQLSVKLEDQETDCGQKSHLLRMAAHQLNHGQFAWLQAQLLDDPKDEDYSAHLKEFCVSFYQVSEYAYKICQKVFGLAPVELVEKWQDDPRTDIASINSTINALFEECQIVPKGLTLHTNVLYEKEISNPLDINGEPMIKIKRSRSDRHNSKKRKYIMESESDEEKDDEYDEGKMSNDEDELLYTSESEEENDEAKNRVNLASNGRPDFNYQHKRVDHNPSPNVPPPPAVAAAAATSVTNAGPSHSSHPDFDFMMDDSSQSTSMQIGSSMPILVPDSPMVPMTHIGGHGRKKIADQAVGSKAIFRVVNP